MTREEILRMEAGPEWDRLVAEQIMGWSEGKHFEVGDFGVVKLGEVIDIWSPSTDIAAAMEVVQKLLEKRLRVSMYSPWGDRNEPYAIPEWTVFVLSNHGLGIEMGGETLPLAICRAALIALEQSE